MGLGRGEWVLNYPQLFGGAAEGLGGHRIPEELRLEGTSGDDRVTQSWTRLCHPTLAF